MAATSTRHNVGSLNESNKTLLKTLWRQEGLCGSSEEADAILEELLTTFVDNEQQDNNINNNIAVITFEQFQLAMKDLFDLDTETCRDLWSQWRDDENSHNNNTAEENEESDFEEGETTGATLVVQEAEVEVEDDSDGGEDEYIGEGECELCERFIRITRHHIIPRQTWSRIGPRLLNAAAAFEKKDTERAMLYLGNEFAHLRNDLQKNDMMASSSSVEFSNSSSVGKRALVRQVLQRTVNVCGPCHSNIHRTHDNLTLGLQYNTMDKLLSDPAIYKFAKWANKQRTGKHCRR